MKTSSSFMQLILIFGILLFCLKGNAQPVPVICMPFNGNAWDISGNNHHGDVVGAVLAPDRFGNPNSAFDFDGVDDHIQIMDSIGSYFPTNEITIVFWAKAESIWNNSPFLLLPNDNSDRLNVHIYYDNNGTQSTFWDYGNISNGGRLYIPNVPFQSAWQHYAFVISESLDSMRVYRDGVLQAGKSGSSGLTDRTRLMNIGGGISDITNCHFNGQIDDVQLFDVALSAGEIYDNFINSNTCMNALQNYITGHVFFDFNSNSTQDIGEPSYANSLLTELNTNRTCYSFTSGDYIFGIDSIGTFEIAPTFFVPYYNSVPSSQIVTFSSIGEVDSLNDFALQPSGTVNDLRVFLSPLTPFRPGFQSAYNIHYDNVGTTTLGGEIVLYFDSLLNFSSASVAPTLVSSDSLVWTISPIQPFEDGDIVVNTVLQIGTPIGTLINSLAKIEPVAGDAAPADNFSSWEVFSTGSYDPNDIHVDRTSIDISETGNPPVLNYMIRFQNTGNDTAFTVAVENVLPIELLSSSFEFINSSHNCAVDYNSGTRNLRFIFNNILLPDSNINEPESHGFIQYRITPQVNLTLGTQIVSNANIFFDFNSPVLTNDAVTAITDFTGLIDVSNSNRKLNLYPNPANEIIHIKINDPEFIASHVELLDMHGKAISGFEIKPIHGNEITLDLKQLDAGVYTIRIHSINSIYTNKVIKF